MKTMGSPLGAAWAGLLALASAMGVGRFVYTPILPAMMAGIGLTPAQAGQVASANFVGYLAGALLFTVWPVPAGRQRAWTVAGLLGGGALTAAMAFVSTVPAFALVRFGSGVMSAVVLLAGSPLIFDRLAQGGALRLGALYFAGPGVGIALSAVLVSGMEAAGATWPALWLASAVLGVAPAPLVWWLLRGPERACPATASSAVAAPGLWSLSMGQLLFGFGYIITATFLVAAVRASPSARPYEPLVWLLVGLAGMPSVVGWNRVAARIGARRAYAIACLIQAVGVAIGGVWTGPAAALLAAILLGATITGLTALGFAAARDIVPAPGIGRAYSLITATFGVGQVAGPLVAGELLERTGSFTAPSLLAAAALAMAATLMWRRVG